MNTELEELNEFNEIVEKYKPVRPLSAADLRKLWDELDTFRKNNPNPFKPRKSYKTIITNKHWIRVVKAKSPKSIS